MFPVSASRARAVAVALLGTLLLTGCADHAKPAPKARPTAIANLNTASLDVPRIEFCSLVPKTAVSQALGGSSQAATSWGNGDRLAVAAAPSATAQTDLVHEIGCEWRRDNGTTARAWVFAQPVTDALAAQVVAAGKGAQGCTTPAGPAYGSPTTTQLCTLPGGAQRVRHAGLFGQTWLSCEFVGPAGAPAAAVRSRADAWCVEVANALNTAR